MIINGYVILKLYFFHDLYLNETFEKNSEGTSPNSIEIMKGELLVFRNRVTHVEFRTKLFNRYRYTIFRYTNFIWRKFIPLL